MFFGLMFLASPHLYKCKMLASLPNFSQTYSFICIYFAQEIEVEMTKCKKATKDIKVQKSVIEANKSELLELNGEEHVSVNSLSLGIYDTLSI
jgi:hypothetical protein